MADEIDGKPAQPGEPQQPQAPEPPASPAPHVPSVPEQAEPAQQPVPPYSGEPQPTTPYGMPQATSPYGVPPQPQAPGTANAQPQPQPTSPYAPTAQQPPVQQPGTPYGGGYMPPQPGAPAYNAPGNGKALGALICGICAIVFSGTVVVGIVLGIVAIVLASQYVKAFGKDGKATGGKVCGIIGIVFSVLALVSYLLLGAVTMAAIDEYNTTYRYSEPNMIEPTTPADPVEPSGSSDSDLSADETAVKELAEKTLNGLNEPDAETTAYVAEKADAAFVDSADSSLADAGVKPEDFAKWLLGSTKAKITSSEVFVADDGTATVYADVRSNNMVEFNDEVYDMMEDFAETVKGSIDESEYQKKLVEFVPKAMKIVDGEDSYIELTFTKSGGDWVVDESSLQEAIDQMLSLY